MTPTSPFQIGDYRAYWAARLASTIANTSFVVVIGLHVYDVARDGGMSIRDAAFWLGMVGLAQFLPLLLLTLVAGYAADRVDRRWIVRVSLLLELVCAALLSLLSWNNAVTLLPLFAVAMALGVGRAFVGPALSAFAPNIVPPALLPSAIALNSMAWQIGAIAGPVVGGLFYASDPAHAYALSSGLLALSLVAFLFIGPIPRGNAGEAHPLQAVVDGLRYVRDNKVVLGAISLDLFVVLLGGATAMLPVYARDILHVGSEGLGYLRAAPAVGAALTALLLARRPLGGNAGVKMFVCVALFGAATVVFGLSKAMWLSLASLVVLGAADMVSVYVRNSLIQLHTPDAMRGRVSAVSGLFVSASNELGEFRSGTFANWMGPIESVAVGGGLAVVITGLCAWRFPELRRADRLVVPPEKTIAEVGNKSFVDDGPPAMMPALDEALAEKEKR